MSMARKGTHQDTIYWTAETLPLWEALQKLPKNKGKSRSEILRALIEKEMDPHTIWYRPDEVTLERLQKVIEHYQKREPEGTVDTPFAVRLMAEEKGREVVDRDTNQMRLGTLYKAFIEELLPRIKTLVEKNEQGKGETRC